MALTKALKVLARSRSLQFARDYMDAQAGAALDGSEGSVLWWCGDRRPVHYRKGTSDVGLIYDILFKPGRKSEYWLPQALQANVVLDIGANVGIAARYLAHRFPGAEIHAFEPILENQTQLRRNVAGTRVQVHEFGLGSTAGEVTFSLPDGARENRGSYSQFAGEGALSVKGQVRAVNRALAELGVSAIDVLKIDVEGAEHDILGAFPDSQLAAITWIYGELHSPAADAQPAFEVLARLARWFDIEVYKPLRKRSWFFDACNRNASKRFRDFRRAH
jgi:FkbM family methyltransferase